MLKSCLAIACVLCAGLGAGCVTTDVAARRDETPTIDKVFFAQNHVLEPANPLFKLAGNLDALIKVQVYSEKPASSPAVFAKLDLEGQSTEITLIGPKQLPRKPTGDPILMEQSYDNSFTALIPKEWVRPGLEVTVELRDYDYSGVDSDDQIYENCSAAEHIKVLDRKVFNELAIGAPTKLVMQMYDIHFFGRGLGADYPQGWEEELEAKLPVSDLKVHRVRNIAFNEIVMPPRDAIPSQRYTSLDDYKAKTGKDFDGEQSVALQWCQALKMAGGRFGRWRLHAVNIAGVYSGGQGGGFRCCANLHRHGVVLHELGHAFGLPHWDSARANYPYTRTMYGEDQGEPTSANAGPTWAFDIQRREFLAPADRMPDGSVAWKKDPMLGGGRGNMRGYMYKHFSDFSIDRIRKCLESAAYWNETLGKYATWNPLTGAYDQVVENDGILFPIERDTDVISILVTANLVVPEGNIIYPPIGPYTAGLIRLFDADSAEDRNLAQELGYVARGKGNMALRVTQGGKTRSYLLNTVVNPDDDPLKTFNTAAINLAGRDGDISKLELIYCPGLMMKGITPDHTVLYTWEGKTGI